MKTTTILIFLVKPNYIDFAKVHKILLGSALFEFFEIKTIQPSKARKQNNEPIDINIIQGFMYRQISLFGVDTFWHFAINTETTNDESNNETSGG